MKFGYKELKVSTGVEFTFTSLPDQQDKIFQQKINEDYFIGFAKEFTKDIKRSKRSFLYKPIKTYLLGDYDACYITFINNFKFSNRVFAPRTDDPIVFKSHSSQSYSGFVLNTDEEIKIAYKSSKEKYFTGIINLKLNNGFLLGNGINYFEYSFNELKKILGNIPFFITQTLAWFDFSLVIFLDSPDELSDIINKIRSLEIGDCQNIIERSLFYNITKKRSIIKNFSIFSDSNTYLGFNKRLIEDPPRSKYLQKFIQFSSSFKIGTEIEWLVKPGHEAHLNRLLKKDRIFKDKFNFSSNKLALGKYDLILPQSERDITTSLHLIRYIFRKKCGLFKHIRKVRTKIFLDAAFSDKKDRSYFSWDNTLSKLAFKQSIHAEIDNYLKALKISRQVRLKIAKIFINFDNGIQDPIQFPYFLDFIFFLKDLKELIYEEFEKSRKTSMPIKELETILLDYIKIFQDGHYVRFLNGYQFENISDFNLDFNSSIPQLLSSYNTLINEYGNLFYEKGAHGQVIQLNHIDTVSNYHTINYSIHHLTSPEFVFSTITKEILNKLKVDYPAYTAKLNEINDAQPTLLEDINETYLDDLIEHSLFDVEYFVIDAIRFIATYQFNFELFNYWFWTYNYQNSSLFETGGMINEDHLRLEMLRIILIKNYFKVDSFNLESPSPELFTLWDRHFDKLNIISRKIINHLELHDISSIINSVIKNLFQRLTLIDNPIELLIDKDTINNMYSMENVRASMFETVLNDNNNASSIKELIKYIYNTLHEHYKMNQCKVNLLRRDWSDGTVLSNHKPLYENILYAIDQTGSVYFSNLIKMDQYFSQNAQSLLAIIDFALIRKKNFVENLLKCTN